MGSGVILGRIRSVSAHDPAWQASESCWSKGLGECFGMRRPFARVMISVWNSSVWATLLEGWLDGVYMTFLDEALLGGTAR